MIYLNVKIKEKVMDRKFVLTSLVYAVIGMSLGIFMAATKDHGQMVSHAHIMLAGFVVTFIYALCHKLWLGNQISLLAKIQFYTHQIGVAIMIPSISGCIILCITGRSSSSSSSVLFL